MQEKTLENLYEIQFFGCNLLRRCRKILKRYERKILHFLHCVEIFFASSIIHVKSLNTLLLSLTQETCHLTTPQKAYSVWRSIERHYSHWLADCILLLAQVGRCSSSSSSIKEKCPLVGFVLEIFGAKQLGSHPFITAPGRYRKVGEK